MNRRSIIPSEMRSIYYDDWKMSPGIICNGLLFLTGMTGAQPDDSIAEDPEQQIRDAFAKVSAVLHTAGLDTSHIIEMTTYHVGISEHIDTFKKVRDELIAEPYPAWTAIEVSGFITPGTIVEIRVIAETNQR
jgi:enamine deaminase RidA (YjgF/YER057c/UK114 family)